MTLRRNRAREEAHTPGAQPPAAEACEGCDKTEQTQNTLFSNDSKRQEVRIRRGGIRRNDQAHCPDLRGFVISKEENPRENKENIISRYNVLVSCVGVVY
nr:MAG TPA: hypothetical protein [Caudoviricetes sp.]